MLFQHLCNFWKCHSHFPGVLQVLIRCSYIVPTSLAMQAIETLETPKTVSFVMHNINNNNNISHTIWSTNRTTIYSSQNGWFSSSYTRSHYWPNFHTMRQDPSLIFIILNKMGPSAYGATFVTLMIQGKTEPIWLIDSSSAYGYVTQFSESRDDHVTHSTKERSNMVQYLHDLYRIIARYYSFSDKIMLFSSWSQWYIL